MLNRASLVRFDGLSGKFGYAVVCISARRNIQGESKRAWYTVEEYQRETIRYSLYPDSAI